MFNITKLEELIKLKGWSNTYFCSQMGHSKVWLTDMKRGRGLPDENVIQSIANRLDTTVDYLTDKTDEKWQKNKPTDKFGRLKDNEKILLSAFRGLSSDQQNMLLRAAGASPEDIKKANGK